LESILINTNTPWYKQFWPWFILSPLLIVICAGFWMLYISIVTSDGVIADNFYKDGLGIETRTEQDALARNMDLQAQLKWIEPNLEVKLSGAMTGYPNQLSLLIIFPTQSARDVSVLLNHQGAGIYTGQLDESVSGQRQLMIEPIIDQSSSMWRLHANTMLPPLSSNVVLKPKAE
jgi:hypothetical protein